LYKLSLAAEKGRGAMAFVLLLVSGPRQPTTWRPLPVGGEPVGFSIENAVDSTRNRGNPPAPRRIQLAVWYPAIAPAATRLTYRDYLALAASKTSANAAIAAAASGEESLMATFTDKGVPVATLQAWLNAKMVATLNAAPAPGRYPLVVIAQGNGESLNDQAVLAEYLASHGYVVVTCPSQTRISGPLASEEEIGTSAEEEARDLEFLIQQVAVRSDVNMRHIGLVGHSFGARGALLVAMRRSDISALVSLDGGIGTATGLASFRAAPSFSPDSMRAPILHIYETVDQFMSPDWTLLRSLHNAAVWVARADAMHHHHFTSLGGLGAGFGPILRATNGTAATTPSFVKVAIAVRTFLDTYIGDAPAALGRALTAGQAPNATGLRIRRIVRP
jgi:dienelactone hydrolase